MRAPAWLLLCAYGCGRLGFENRTQSSSGTSDAARATVDASTAVCQQPAPFLALTSVEPSPTSPGFLDVTWCYAGLVGPADVVLITQLTMIERGRSVAAISDRAVQFLLGGQSCNCFVRITSDGLTAESEPTVYPGD